MWRVEKKQGDVTECDHENGGELGQGNSLKEDGKLTVKLRSD